MTFVGVTLNIKRVINKENNNIQNKTLLLKKDSVIYVKDSIINLLQKQKDTLNTIITVAHNKQVLFENIVGVKKPDGIITYKEKCLVTNDRMIKLIPR